MRVFRLFLSIMLMTWSLMVSAASYDELKPLLIDITDWQGANAEGTSMDSNGMKMIIANRNYKHGDTQNFDVQVGLMPSAASSAMQMNMNMETDEIIINTSTIDDFPIYQNYDKAPKSGSILVMLAKGNEQNSVMFIMSYTGISNQEALKIAKQFDWKKMKTASEALLH
ncbi:hypothetical protein DOJK_01913 [Patescibacteria group bacterium]|nr:hypothetical protein DOJK_01913 [Patescibacteria group bacterium]